MIDREVGVNQDYIFKETYFEKGLAIIPTSATITIYNQSGVVVINGASMTVNTTTGELTYTWLAASNTKEENNFKVMITYVYNAISTKTNYLIDVVKNPLRCIVSDEDLFIQIGELREKVKEKTVSTDTIGTVNACVIKNLLTDVRDYTGGYVSFFIDSDPTCTIQHDARILSHSQITGAITFSPSYTCSIPAQTTCRIRPSYKQSIDNAFNRFVIRDIRAKANSSYGSNKTASGYINSDAINMLVVSKALETICFSQVEETGDKWEIRYKRFYDMYNTELGKMFEPYDQDASGTISETENDNRPSFSFMSMTR